MSEPAATCSEPEAERITATMDALLAERGAGKTICPSEVARAVAAENDTPWRDWMPAVRVVAGRRADAGEIVILQRGEEVDIAAARGAIRIGRAND